MNTASENARRGLGPKLLAGEALRWYLKRARHPFKDYIVGHYWPWFSAQRFWVRYDESSVIRLKLGDYLQQRIFFDGYYEAELIAWLKTTLTSNDVLWDIGANVGAITIAAARLCRDVVSFEPDPRTGALLKQNVEANALTNVHIVNVALSDRNGSVDFHQASDRNSGMSSLIAERAPDAARISVRAMRGDDLLATTSTPPPTVIKMDVEGAEGLVLSGMSTLLSTHKVRAIVFEDQRAADGGPANAVVSTVLARAGYQIGDFGESVPGASLTGDGVFNFLAVPRESIPA